MTHPLPATVDDWLDYLSRYSADYLRDATPAELAGLDRAQREAGWLGFAPATEADVAAVEGRLGRRLPASFRNFLLTSNGWRHLGPLAPVVRPLDRLGWFRHVEVGAWALVEDEDLAERIGRCLVLTGGGDDEYWLLDPADVGEDGEWTAHTWARWSPALGDRSFPSFAALVAAARSTFEQFRGAEGRPVPPDDADDPAAEGRWLALTGDVKAARRSFAAAAAGGSVRARYLDALLAALVEPGAAVEHIRNDVLADRRVLDGVDRTHLLAELLPLYLRLARECGTARFETYLRPAAHLLPEADDEETEPLAARAEAFVPPVLPEPPAFERALREARALSAAGDHDGAWAAVAGALPQWHSRSPYRIAPVVLLTDPLLHAAVTPDRYRFVATTPRGPSRRRQW